MFQQQEGGLLVLTVCSSAVVVLLVGRSSRASAVGENYRLNYKVY
jgi:hypothetical protein